MKFIKRYNAVVDMEFCEKVIEVFEQAHDAGLGTVRNEPDRTIDQQQEFALAFNRKLHISPGDFPKELEMRQEWISRMFFEVVQNKIEEYLTDMHMMEAPVWYFRNMLVQKYDHEDCGGYHSFHCESGDLDHSDRWLVYMLYLNDVPEGEGETEFLYQGHRERPKAGDLLIWPAGFTHTHRGNPVTTTNKYVATGWVFFGRH